MSHVSQVRSITEEPPPSVGGSNVNIPQEVQQRYLFTSSSGSDIGGGRQDWQTCCSGVKDWAGLPDRVHERRVRRPVHPPQVHPRAEGPDDTERGHLQVAGRGYQREPWRRHTKLDKLVKLFYNLKFGCLFVLHRFNISNLCPETCQTPHIIHNWKEGDIRDEKRTRKTIIWHPQKLSSGLFECPYFQDFVKIFDIEI